ncbi:hypothetical protein HZH66_003782 [Vespula vulgaris]|uniref:Uncharacterized protein n=1 Tax=Vespula vulgaris TaxID=7454 RepID=A0A834KFL1_VESVU|nr:hypothetical protein HZH66_003782 [Vespula vulgaris]
MTRIEGIRASQKFRDAVCKRSTERPFALTSLLKDEAKFALQQDSTTIATAAAAAAAAATNCFALRELYYNETRDDRQRVPTILPVF